MSSMLSGLTFKFICTKVLLHRTIVLSSMTLLLYESKIIHKCIFLKTKNKYSFQFQAAGRKTFNFSKSFCPFFFAYGFHTSRFIFCFTNKFNIYLRIGNGYISLVFVLKFKIFISLKDKAKISSTFYSWQSQRNSIPNTLIHIHIFIISCVSTHREISFQFLKVDHKVLLYTLRTPLPNNPVLNIQ